MPSSVLSDTADAEKKITFCLSILTYLTIVSLDQVDGSIQEFKKVQVGNDPEKEQSERNSHSENRGGKKK